MIPDTLRPWLGRIAAILVSGLAGLLFAKFGIEVSDNERAVLSEVVGTVLIMLTGYVLTHVSINKVVNPEDASSTGAAREGKMRQEARHAATDQQQDA